MQLAAEIDPDVVTEKPKEKKDLTAEEFQQFELLWRTYGKRGPKNKALQSWRRLSIENRIRAQKGAQAFAAGRELKFRPYLSKWINEKQWDIELPEQKTVNDSKPVDRLGNQVKNLW